MANTTSKSKEPDVQGSAGSSVLGFHRLKTRNKILVGFAVPVCFVVIIAVIVHRSIGALIETAGSVQHTQTVISGGQELLRLMIDMETGERGFLITGKNEFLQPFTDAQELWNEKIINLRNLVSDNPAQVQRLDRIDNLEKQWLEEAAAVEISKRRSVQIGNKSLAYMQDTLRRGVGKNILDRIRANLDRITTSVFESGNQYAANLLLAIAKDIVDQETGQRGFLITGDESFLEPYLSGQRSFNRNVSDFRRVVESAYRKQDILNEIAALQKLPERWLVEAATQEIQLKRELLASSSSSSSSSSNFGTIEERLSRGTGKSILDSMRSVMSAMNRDFERARNLSAQTLVGLIIKDLVDQETGQRGFLLTGKDEFLRPFEIG